MGAKNPFGSPFSAEKSITLGYDSVSSPEKGKPLDAPEYSELKQFLKSKKLEVQTIFTKSTNVI